MRRRLRRTKDDLFADLRIDSLFTSSTVSIRQARQPRFPKTLLPVNDYGSTDTQSFRRLYLAQTIGPIQNNPRALVISVRCRRAIYNCVQRAPLLGIDIERTNWPRHERSL